MYTSMFAHLGSNVVVHVHACMLGRAPFGGVHSCMQASSLGRAHAHSGRHLSGRTRWASMAVAARRWHRGASRGAAVRRRSAASMPAATRRRRRVASSVASVRRRRATSTRSMPVAEQHGVMGERRGAAWCGQHARRSGMVEQSQRAPSGPDAVGVVHQAYLFMTF